MDARVLLYGLSAGAVVYPYALYPAWLALRAKWGKRPVRRGEGGGGVRRTVSVVIAAYNEEANIGRRIAEMADRLVEAGLTGEVIVVSDGSSDATVAAARAAAARTNLPVIVESLETNVGKAAAITVGVALARHEIVVLADARQTWAADALQRLLENFDDPEVGAVSGELFVGSAPGVMAGVGLYWRYEKWLRKQESAIHSTVGLTGSICAVRRALFRSIPPGTVLDDVYWPLQVVLQGFRVVFDGRAHAFDRLPDHVGAEFRRKVRTLAGNFQLVASLPEILLPWRNPVWFALYSHKLMRLVVPWAWLALIGLAIALGGPLYLSLLAAQLGVTGLGLVGLSPRVGARFKLAAALGSFLVLNAAAGMAFWVWLSGRTARSWTKTRYSQGSSACPSPTLEGSLR